MSKKIVATTATTFGPEVEITIYDLESTIPPSVSWSKFLSTYANGGGNESAIDCLLRDLLVFKYVLHAANTSNKNELTLNNLKTILTNAKIYSSKLSSLFAEALLEEEKEEVDKEEDVLI